MAVSSFGLLGVVVEAWVRLEPFTNAVDFTAWKRPLNDLFPADPTDPKAKANLRQLFEGYDSAILTWCVRRCAALACLLEMLGFLAHATPSLSCASENCVAAGCR